MGKRSAVCLQRRSEGLRISSSLFLTAYTFNGLCGASWLITGQTFSQRPQSVQVPSSTTGYRKPSLSSCMVMLCLAQTEAQAWHPQQSCLLVIHIILLS